MQLIKFGNYMPPTPTKYSLTLQDIDSDDTLNQNTAAIANSAEANPLVIKIIVKRDVTSELWLDGIPPEPKKRSSKNFFSLTDASKPFKN